jgi:radical SAM superfamily enzyme YgiQ (UPF0313 family)
MYKKISFTTEIMTDIILINASMTYGAVARGINHYPPMGLCYLSTSLRKAGISSRIIDLGIEPFTAEEIVDIIKTEKAKLVGISAKTPQIHNTMRIVRGIRECLGDSVTIALGGYHISNDRTFLERYPDVDFGVVGDGDITFPQLAQKVLSGEKTKGIFYGELIKTLDDVGEPAYDMIPLSKYKDMGMNAYPIIGTRGCPFDCIFCSRAPMSKKVRYRSTESLLDEMKKYYGDFGGRYEFQDESFSLKRNNVIEFCEAVIKWGRKIHWTAGGMRLDQVDDNLMELMWNAGCRGCFVGIESGSERVRNEIVGKRITDEQIFKAFRIMDKYGFAVEISLVLGHPTETEDELKQTVYFPSKLKKMGIRCITQAGLKPAVPMPGSRLWDIAIKEGKIPSDLIDRYIRLEIGEDFWSVWPTYVPDGLTVERIKELRKLGYLAYYLHPRYIFWRLKRDIKSWKLLRADAAEFWSLIKKGHSTVSLTE